MRVLAFLLVMLWAAPVWAQAWYTNLDSTGTAVTSLSPSGKRLAYWMFTTDTSSPVLQTLTCRYMDIQFDPNTAGTAGSATVYVYRCLSNSGSANTCAKILPLDTDGTPLDAPLNGDVTVRKAGFQNIQASWLWVDVVTNRAGAETPALKVTCHE